MVAGCSLLNALKGPSVVVKLVSTINAHENQNVLRVVSVFPAIGTKGGCWVQPASCPEGPLCGGEGGGSSDYGNDSPIVRPCAEAGVQQGRRELLVYAGNAVFLHGIVLYCNLIIIIN